MKTTLTIVLAILLGVGACKPVSFIDIVSTAYTCVDEDHPQWTPINTEPIHFIATRDSITLQGKNTQVIPITYTTTRFNKITYHTKYYNFTYYPHGDLIEIKELAGQYKGRLQHLTIIPHERNN